MSQRVIEIEERLNAAKGKVFDVIFPDTCEPEVRVAIVHSTSDAYWLLERVKVLEGLLRYADVYVNKSYFHDKFHAEVKAALSAPPEKGDTNGHTPRTT